MEFSIRSSGFLMFSSEIKDMKIMIMTKKKGGLKEGQVDESFWFARLFVRVTNGGKEKTVHVEESCGLYSSDKAEQMSEQTLLFLSSFISQPLPLFYSFPFNTKS